MILACHHISKSFGTDVILHDLSFHIEEHEKAAIIGVNGAGKSTLLKIIIGELNADAGEVITAKGATVGYLAQHHSRDSNRSIYEELLDVKRDILTMEERLRELEASMKLTEGEELENMLKSYASLHQAFEDQNGYALQSEITGVLKGLGFTEEEFDRPVSILSGGQKTRVALGRLLLSKPDILLLDEPTNHLDMNSTAWLENFLMNYKGAVLIVAHDRYFLDKVATKIIEIDHHEGRMYMGNYSAYAKQRELIRNAQKKAWAKQQQEIAHQEAVITKLKQFNREKSIKRAESREKMLDKVVLVDKPIEDTQGMRLNLEPDTISGNDVLFVQNLSKSFGSHQLFTGLCMDLKRGEKVALIGENGSGKTTILKILNGLESADTCEIRYGTKVQIGYYDQEHQVLHENKTIFEEIQDEYPTMTGTKIRNMLAAFLFTGDDVFKPISELSGGERGRVSLAKLMLSRANFLILDEPTNHLDIQSREILEEAINSYTGTVLYVSHDRYFINRTADRILDLQNGGLNNYIGNYDAYIEKKEHPSIDSSGGFSNPIVSKEPTVAEMTTSKDSYLKQKAANALERKRKARIRAVEKRIDEIESRQTELTNMLQDPDIAVNMSRLMEINEENESLDIELLELMDEWESLNDA